MWALAVGGIVAAFLLVRWRHSDLKWFDFLEREAIRLFARLWHRCTSAGPDPLPVAGPAILVANHPTQADPAFLIASCKRPPRFLQAREYYRVFLLRHLFDWVGCIPVDRGGREVTGIRLALRRLREGMILGIFPDGDLSAVRENRHGEVKGGAALLALRAKAPVFPAYIAGGPQGRPLLQAWLWPSRGVKVIYGPPVDLSAYRDRRLNRQVIQEVTALLMERIKELRPVPSKTRPKSFALHPTS
jgi:1-acyl-sn-glycerol-3-phosphate acyltransferase